MTTKLIGSIDTVRFEGNTLVLEGWAAYESGLLNCPFEIEINGRRRQYTKKEIARPDVSRAIGDWALNAGFIARVQDSFSPFDYPKSIRVSVDGASGCLPVHSTSIFHQIEGILQDSATFWRYVQNPGTRVKDRGTLRFLAGRAIASYRRNASVQAAAVCVIVWQDLLGVADLADPKRGLRFGRFLLGRLKSQDDVSSFRWFVSLANALAFLAIKSGDHEVSNDLFFEIVEITSSHGGTWLCVPNGITARFMLGYSALSVRDLTNASEWMYEAFKFFEDRILYFRVDNFWSFDEMLEVARLAQQAFLAHELIEQKGNSPKVNANDDIDVSRITTQLIATFVQRKIIDPVKIRSLLNIESD